MYYTLICGETFYFLDRGFLPQQKNIDMVKQDHVYLGGLFTLTSPGWYIVDVEHITHIDSWWCIAEIVGFGPSQPNMYGRSPDPSVVKFFKSMFPKPQIKHVVLYHGTSLVNAQSIMRNGFKLPTCKKKKECLEGQCRCGMMGQCLYFAMYDKAVKFANEDAHWNKRREGDKAVVRALVRMGKWTTATSKPCQCCGQPFVDHKGTWYTDHHYDTLYLKEHSLPAARRPEWATRTPHTKPLSLSIT